MKKLFPLIFLLILVQTAWAGKTLHLRSSSFTFSVTEPEGWAIDFRSAAQVANFVMHRRGTTWRNADVIVLARFNRMPGNDSLQTLVEMESQEFQRKCPLSEVQDVNWEIDGSHDFLVKTVYCTGVRHEIVAFTKVPGFFITFILSSEQESRLQASVLPFQELLSSFLWVEQQPSVDSDITNRPGAVIGK